jgi:hypothetical protein
MTMQIGMVGSDGVLIASDTLWMNTEENQYAHTRHTSNTTKIELDYKKGIAIACARHMELASRIAKDLLVELDDEDWGGPDTRATHIADRALGEADVKRRDFQCTIITAYPEPRLFQLHSGIHAGQKGSRCQTHSSKVVAGDTANSAVFWSERYYSSWTESLRPIEELIPLAAHLVCSAGRIGPGAIGGLEIVVCNSSGLRRLSDSSISKLEAISKGWDSTFSNQIFSHKAQFEWDKKSDMRA